MALTISAFTDSNNAFLCHGLSPSTADSVEIIISITAVLSKFAVKSQRGIFFSRSAPDGEKLGNFIWAYNLKEPVHQIESLRYLCSVITGVCLMKLSMQFFLLPFN
jgi:hypothetical protein